MTLRLCLCHSTVGRFPAMELTYHYIKGASFRVSHVDGAVCGVTPSGGVHLAVFSERAPIPQRVTHQLTAEGKIDTSVAPTTVVKDGIVRELDVDLVMNLSAAKAIHELLGAKIRLAEEAMKAAEPAT